MKVEFYGGPIDGDSIDCHEVSPQDSYLVPVWEESTERMQKANVKMLYSFACYEHRIRIRQDGSTKQVYFFTGYVPR